MEDNAIGFSDLDRLYRSVPGSCLLPYAGQSRHTQWIAIALGAPVIQAIMLNEAAKAAGHLFRLLQFWLDTIAHLTAIIETVEEGKLTTDPAVLATQMVTGIT